MSNRPKPTTLHSSSHFSRTAQAFPNAINSFDFVWLCFPLCWATVDKAFRERNKRASDHNGIQTFIVNFSFLLDENVVSDMRFECITLLEINFIHFHQSEKNHGYVLFEREDSYVIRS